MTVHCMSDGSGSGAVRFLVGAVGLPATRNRNAPGMVGAWLRIRRRGRLFFNRTVLLKDEWARIEKQSK
jgi:hypothetical protein